MGRKKNHEPNSLEVFQESLAEIVRDFDQTPVWEIEQQLQDLLLMMTMAVGVQKLEDKEEGWEELVDHIREIQHWIERKDIRPRNTEKAWAKLKEQEVQKLEDKEEG